MISSEAFTQSLLNLSMSVDEFSRISGISKRRIRKYFNDGVPDKETETVIQLLKAANKKICSSKQVDVEDYINGWRHD